MVVVSRDMTRSLAKVQADHLLTVISGCITLSTAFHCHRNPYAKIFSTFAAHKDGYNVTSAVTSLMSVVGAVNIVIAAARFNGYCKFNFNKYIFSLVTTLLCNFALGVVLTDHRGKLSDSLEAIMRPQLQESVLSQLSLGVGFTRAENWDFLQIQMSCCGVESYQDYLVKKLPHKEQPLPMSCCVMRRPPGGETSLPVPENLSQCMLDATHKAVESVFLHVQGCRGPLSRWLVRHISKMTAMIFAAICCQAMTLLYLSWQGFQSSNMGRS